MDVKGVDANLLVALEAILIECNLTRAGERLGITQPAMSGALARLRVQFDDPLLVRTGRAYDLTPKASAMLPAVREAVAAVSRTLQVRPGFEPAVSTRRFVITASDYALSVLAGPLLRRVGRVAPSVALDFAPLPAESTVEEGDLQRRDLLIASADRGLPGRRLEIFRDRFVVIADQHNRALVDGALSAESIAALPHVAGVFGELNPTPVDDALAAVGIVPRRVVTCRGFTAVPFFIAGTDRIGIVPWRIAHRASDLGLVVVDADLTLPVLVEAAHFSPSAVADPGVTWLLDQLASLI